MILHKEVDLKKSYFEPISALAKDFIMKALQRDIEQRYSAKQLLNHPWLIQQSKVIDQKLSDDEQK